MREDVKKALEVLFGDPAKAEAFAAQVDDTNRSIEADPAVIARDSTADAEAGKSAQPEAPAEQAAAPAADPATAPDPEAALQEIAARAAGLVKVPDHSEALSGLQKGLEGLTASVEGLQARLTALEASDEEKRARWVNDLPARAAAKVDRPRDREEAQGGKPGRLAEIAAATLANMK